MVACHVPALLIPYPQAMDDHQYKNASFLEKKGICLQKREGEIRPGDIKMHLNEIWSTLESRQEKARALKEHHSKYTLKDLVMENLA
jgi:UDP-N-acetylglucosamine--N-acetylmuramyl-(pentapeptide) pyrophosphoryl-undecaprenol N-acetylglucosamine transferase